MSAIDICQMTGSDIEIWNQYVNQSSDSTFFHLAQWQTIFEKILNHRPYYLMAKASDKVVGIFPLVQVKSRLFGMRLFRFHSLYMAVPLRITKLHIMHCLSEQ